jgi:hypothetical protein
VISNASGIHEELERILETKWLRESHQLSALLRHVVEETIAGRTAGLKEYSLGLEVFHRPSDYDPRNDAIVRVQASLLRKRLTAYYEHEGRDAVLRITLPRGGYIPQFETVEPETAPTEAPAEIAVRSAALSRPRWPLVLGGFVAGAILAGWLGYAFSGRPSLAIAECPALWEGFARDDIETITSFGVPLFFTGGGGLFVRDTQVNRLTDNPRQVDKVGEALGISFRPQEDVYTGVGDAIGTHHVTRWLEQHGIQARIANSNYIGLSDVEGKNLVVISSARFQTLLQQMNLPDQFPFSPATYGGGYRSLDPLPGELPYYQPKGGDAGVNTSYAVVSLWPGSPPDRRMMYLSGIETWSTQGAAQYVIDPDRLADLNHRLSADPPDGPRGRKSPFFQVLLRVEGKNNRVRNSTYVTHRYLPPPQKAPARP